MKLFNFQGGVHPNPEKHFTAHKPIRPLPLPKRLHVPLQQHIGAAAVSEVSVGERVLKGQIIGRQQGAISAPVHAPSSGTVVSIDPGTAPHVSGLSVVTVVIETDGLEEWINLSPAPDPFALTPEEIADQVGAAGIVGMGGAAFPAAVKLSAGNRTAVNTLILNGAECEPYLTCDDRLMRELPDEVVDGARLMRHALKAQRIIVVLEDNKPEALAALTQAARNYSEISVVAVPTRYPMGSEKQMIRTVTGLEVPAGGLGTDIGVLVHNVATAQAVHRALRRGWPLLSRIVTVTGSAVDDPMNLDVPIGTKVSELVDFCSISLDKTARLLMGGPMMGQQLPSVDAPIVKGLNGIVALAEHDVDTSPTMPCIRCGRCVDACPVGLLPIELWKRAHNEDFQGALDYGLIDCIACGSCSYSCPSHIPIVHYISYAKGELANRQRAEQKTKETKRLAEQRQERLEREARLQAEAAERRKAEREAKKKAREAAKQAKAAAKAAANAEAGV